MTAVNINEKEPTQVTATFFNETEGDNPIKKSDWEFASFCRRHAGDNDRTPYADPTMYFLRVEDGYPVPIDARIEAQLLSHSLLFLSCFEGYDPRRVWFIASDTPAGLTECDVTPIAGVLVQKASNVTEMTGKQAIEDARKTLTQYNGWLAGACYGYELQIPGIGNRRKTGFVNLVEMFQALLEESVEIEAVQGDQMLQEAWVEWIGRA